MQENSGNISAWKTVRTFATLGPCSETLFNVVDRAYENPLPTEEHAATPLAGGLMQKGYQCGLIWGAALAAGARAYEVHGVGPVAEAAALDAARELVASFGDRFDDLDCRDLTGTDWMAPRALLKYLLKGGTIRCFRLAAQFAPVAFDQTERSLSEARGIAPDPPVSCAAELAKAMGASERHAVMASGLAGGIGLCGGACGALGAAIWISGLDQSEDSATHLDMQPPAALAAVERFRACTDGEFLCSKITGRTFESTDDHGDFLRGGGCSDVIEALAAGQPSTA